MRLTLNITALLLTSTFSEHTASQEVADDEIIISGARSDRVFQRRGGTSTSIRPSEETRFDVGSHFKLDPSLRGIDTGRSTNGGFSVPLFRGHDVRSTNVCFDDVLLQDPFTGFPLVEDIDLRSFGELHIHKGLAPWNIPITQPGGVIQFITRPPAFGRSTKIGSALSTENSQSAWVEENRKTNASSIKGYFRRRTSAGKYEFYDDNQTIRNPDDDRVRKRENNQSNSSLSSFAGERRFDHAGIKSLLWYQTSELGIPAKGSFDDGSARLKNHTGVGSAHANFKLSDEFSLRISSQYTRLQKQFRDPQRNIGLTSGQESTASTTRNAISLTKHGDIFFIFI